MYCEIDFRPSSVPFSERDIYLEKLNKVAHAWRNEDSNDYEIFVISQFFGGDWKKLQKILRELVKRGCVIQDKETGKWLFGRKRPEWF